MAYRVYILKSITNDRYYIGSSENQIRRLTYHNTIEKGFTSRYRAWQIILMKECATKSEAQVIEKKIKSWKCRIMIEKIIAGEINI